MLILLFFAFISGLITIAAPCIWPLLPIVLSSSIKGGKKKSLGTALGISFSFAILTLTISYIVTIIPFDPNVLRIIAVLVIAISGLTLIIPKLSEFLQILVSRLSSKLGGSGVVAHREDSFLGGLLTGIVLGIVWSPCAGPILATIASLSATRAVNLGIVLVTLVYALGISIPLFLFSLLGNTLLSKVRLLSPHLRQIELVFGTIMILFSIAIYTNYDKYLQAKLLSYFPSYSSALNQFESNPNIQKQLQSLKSNNPQPIPPSYPLTNIVNSNLPVLSQAPEFAGVTNWLNTQPLTMLGLRGKVVLVDFWTYTCINCIRTLPFINGWYDKYKDQGFVVVGVHTPEFEFEKNTANVQMALNQYGIKYPVAQDNNYGTWNAYSNLYWPADYLIDAQGNIRDAHFGEGDYDTTEVYIQKLLAEAGKTVNSQLLNMPDQTPTQQLTPETYLGSKRMERFSSPETVLNQLRTYSAPKTLSLNNFALSGGWNIQPEFASGSKDASLTLRFVANKVFLVLHPKGTSDSVKVFLDDKPVDSTNAGKDVINSVLNVNEPRLYELIDLKGNNSDHVLKLLWQNDGIEAYAFTFG
jgi:cytochrome c biogenesis protein CcdA/thiol-disulfide isomerase/thioredoxin